jgi:hypothetical protein
MSTTVNIFQNFPISNDEYIELESKFEDLCKFAAWQLKRKNVKNNCTDELDDYIQEFRTAMVHAGSYYKRQLYIEACLETVAKYAKDKFTKKIIKELQRLWENRKCHGASRQRFGEYQERILERIVKRIVPKEDQPNKNRSLIIDKKFPTYCKNIIWNRQKAVGKKISRERCIRTGLVSLSSFDYLGGVNKTESAHAGT